MVSADALAEVLFGKQEGRFCVLVCGGRDYDDEYTLYLALDALHRDPGITEIIQGGARGADALAKAYAKERCILSTTFYANWDAHDKGAGPIRNQKMLDAGKPDFVLAFPGGKGTADMIARARKAGVEVYKIEGSLR